MSLRMSALPVTATGPLGAQTEQRPRFLQQPDSQFHNSMADSEKGLKAGTAAGCKNPISRPNGNCKPQEPPFMMKSVSGTQKKMKTEPNEEEVEIDPLLTKSPSRTAGHIHPLSWSSSSQRGKRESPEGANPFHRVWLQETGMRPRWNRQRKREFYNKQDTEMSSKIPTQEKFAAKQANYTFWSHLDDAGCTAGGQNEKLDYTYTGWARGNVEPTSPTFHFYRGKFSNVKHCQRIIQTGKKDGTERPREIQRDTRNQFDNRLKDDMIRYNDSLTIWAHESGYDTHRPHKTASLPQLGAEYCHR